MKSRTTVLALSISLMLILVSVAPASALSDKARIRALVNKFMTLVAQGDFQAAAKLRIRNPPIPAKGSFKYRMIIRVARSFSGIEKIELRGNRAKAYLRLDPKVVEDVAKQLYQYQLDKAKKITNPKRRAAVIESLQKHKAQIIAARIKNMSRSGLLLRKTGGKWIIR